MNPTPTDFRFPTILSQRHDRRFPTILRAAPGGRPRSAEARRHAEIARAAAIEVLG